MADMAKRAKDYKEQSKLIKKCLFIALENRFRSWKKNDKSSGDSNSY